MSPAELARAIIDECRALGFHRAGVTPVAPEARHALFRSWLASGYAGEMDYLARDAEPRRDPGALLDGARTLVAVALSYAAPEALAPAPPGGPRGFVARYARGQDYHKVLKDKLRALARRIAGAAGRPVAWRACVDTAPVLERDAAERAGLGFVAKNTMLIAPGLGSYVLLGELLLDVEVAPTAREPERKRCGECRACLDACPTGAFVDAYLLDARRCISYLTIEHAGPIPIELREKLGTMIFGCDVCQEVCPFNAPAAAPREPPDPALAPGAARTAPELIPLLSINTNQFRRLVRGSAMRRVTREQLQRNVCVALGNAGDPTAIPSLRAAAAGSSALVREHALWALERLGDVDWITAQGAIGYGSGIRAGGA